MCKQHINLSEADHTALKALLSQGKLSARTYRRAFALLELNRGKTYTAVAQTVGVTKQSVSIWAANYRANGLDSLTDQQRSGRPKKLLSVDEAKITALACSEPPEGYSQWSLRLLADHAVELIEAESISYSGVRRILKKTNSSRT
jgi:transposase